MFDIRATKTLIKYKYTLLINLQTQSSIQNLEIHITPEIPAGNTFHVNYKETVLPRVLLALITNMNT